MPLGGGVVNQAADHGLRRCAGEDEEREEGGTHSRKGEHCAVSREP